MRKLVIALIAGALVLGLAGEAMAVDASSLDTSQVVRIVGARFIVRTHVGGAFYNGNRHTVNGTVYLRNQANRARNVNCDVRITFSAKHGQAWRKRTAHFRTHVGPHRARSIDYSVKLHDSSGRFKTLPTNQVTHCHTPSRR
jgi:hypothetical protein